MKLPSLDTVPVPSRNAHAHRVSLGVMENLVLTLMDGRNSICDIGDACGLETEMAQRILKRLFDLKLVDLPGFHINGTPAEKSQTSHTTASQAGNTSPFDNGREGIEAAVAAFHEKVGRTNLYDLLGVTPDADRKAIRSAYFALSKKFHPDRAFGRNLEDIHTRMTLIFHELTRAYDILSNPKQRKAYDDKLGVRISRPPVSSDAPPAGAPCPPPQVAPPIGPRAPVGRPEVRSARSVAGPTPATTAVARSASAGRTPTPEPAAATTASQPVRSSSIPLPRRSSIPPTAIDSAEAAVRREQWKKERLQRAFAGRVNMTPRGVAQQPGNPVTAGRSLGALLDHARIALERFEYDEAIRSLQSILSMDADNIEATEMMKRACEGKNHNRAASLIKEGRLLQARGVMVDAIRQYEKAIAVDRDNVEARYFIASLLLELNTDFPRALTLTREIIVKGGMKAKYYALLGELMIKEHAPARAVEAFQKAMQMDPNNPDYKKRLKTLQGN